LQVGGTELDDPRPPPAPAPGRPVILMSPHVEMTAGKSMAQAGHAAQLGWRAASPDERDRWRAHSFELAVRVATTRQWAAALRSGAPVVHDGGFTEVEPDTQTAAALLPWLGSSSGESSGQSSDS
jgi:peptidyl-tRNA hydrolase